MLAPSDIISLACTPDLIESGIAYACRFLAHAHDRMGGSPVERLRHIVAGVAVELAFRRYLGEQGVPFGVLEATPFTDPDHYDVFLGGHRCDVKHTLVSHRRQVSLLRREPGLLLQAPALVPLDRYTAEERKPDDIYLFAFLMGVVAAAQGDVDRAQAAGQPVYLIHPMPGVWARPSGWIPLERLALKSECDRPITIEIGGQDVAHSFVTQVLDLPPRTRTLVPEALCSVAYLRADRRPEARIGIHSPLRGAAYLIQPIDWGNLWVYGMNILLAGWITHENFRRKAMVLNPGMSTMLSDRTREKNLLVPVAELNPLAPLFSKVKTWNLEHTLR
jgi:hypothetical protein